MRPRTGCPQAFQNESSVESSRLEFGNTAGEQSEGDAGQARVVRSLYTWVVVARIVLGVGGRFRHSKTPGRVPWT